MHWVVNENPLENVIKCVVNERLLNDTSMSVESLFKIVCFNPCFYRKLGLVGVGGDCAVAHTNATVPKQETTIVESPDGILRRVVGQ
jgi:hypothetical protein